MRIGFMLLTVGNKGGFNDVRTIGSENVLPIGNGDLYACRN
jgi:hypothetical protein